jgi:hypothetical protein
MLAAPSGAAGPAGSVFFEVAGFGRVVGLAMVWVLVTPDPEEALSILSSPAPGLPFLWLCAISDHVTNRPFENECKGVHCGAAQQRTFGFHTLSAISELSQTIARPCYIRCAGAL